MKAIYQKPVCLCIEIGHDKDLMLAMSGNQTVVTVSDDYADEGEGGLSRRHQSVWDDEDDEDDGD